MKGFGKVAGIGLGAVFAVLLAMTMVGGPLMAAVLPGPLTVSVPEAVLSDVVMYGSADSGVQAYPAPVVVQEIDSLSCPLGQTITRSIQMGPFYINSTITMATANLTNVLMKASSLNTTNGTLNDVTMFALADMGGDPPGTKSGLEQDIVSGTMYNLTSLVYFVSMASLDYTDMAVEVTTTVP